MLDNYTPSKYGVINNKMYHCKKEEYCIELNSIGFGIFIVANPGGAHEFTEFQHTGVCVG